MLATGKGPLPMNSVKVANVRGHQDALLGNGVGQVIGIRKAGSS